MMRDYNDYSIEGLTREQIEQMNMQKLQYEGKSAFNLSITSLVLILIQYIGAGWIIYHSLTKGTQPGDSVLFTMVKMGWSVLAVITIGMACNAIRKGNRAHNIEAGKKGRKRAVIALGLSVISVVVVAVVMFC